ncbi:hypothetical protein A7982_12635 [Minicystis rosea]|nr:hypothetical protein A7982_12635 [Minicystis rosea]
MAYGRGISHGGPPRSCGRWSTTSAPRVLEVCAVRPSSTIPLNDVSRNDDATNTGITSEVVAAPGTLCYPSRDGRRSPLFRGPSSR